MEANFAKRGPSGAHEVRYRSPFLRLSRLFRRGLRLTGLFQRGIRNALDLRLNEFDLIFADLPIDFDGFRILHLSDLHVDSLRESVEAAARLIAGLEFDLCVLTGDYRARLNGPFDHILPDMRNLFSQITVRQGIYAVLGNHDGADMVDALEELGAVVLVNEAAPIRVGDSVIHVVGTDDVHYYYTHAARTALETAPDGFKVALVHSAELADVAAENGFHLYLAGHSHGGQVAFPGGRPIATRMFRHRALASGLWRFDRMVGYTTTGVGVSVVPVRFNTRGEVASITLRRASERS